MSSTKLNSFLITAWTLATLFIISSIAAAQSAAIDVSAAPTVILADGTSVSHIRANVRDELDQPVADGTEVMFQTTLGHITPTATTNQGIAEAELISDTSAGVATVTASVGNLRAEVKVEFALELDSTTQGSRVISISGGWLGYYVGDKIVVGLQDVKLTYQTYEISAKTSLYFNVSSQEVLARDVTVRSPKGQIHGLYIKARFSSSGLKGHLFQVDGDVKLYYFEGRDFSLKEVEGAISPDLFRSPETDDTSLWIKARQIIIFPREKIAFKRAEFYVGQTRAFTVPYHVLSLNSFSPPTANYLNYSTLGGVSVDIPLYYNVTRNRTGAVRIRKGQRGSWLSQRPGWSLAIEEEYSPNPDVESTLVVDGLLRKDWGVRCNHRQRFEDGSYMNWAMGYPSHRFFYSNLSWYGRKQDYSFDFRADFSKPDGGPSRFDIANTRRTFHKPLGDTNWNYFTTLKLGFRRDLGADKNILRQKTTLSLFPETIKLNKSSNLSFRADFSLLCDTSGARGTEFLGRLGTHHHLGKSSHLSLSYLYSDKTGDVLWSIPSRQQLNANLFWRQDKASGYLSANYDLGQKQFSGFGAYNYNLSKDLRLGLRSQYQKYFGNEYFDNQLSLIKNIGGRGVALKWSQSRHKIWVELLPGRF